MQIIGTIRYDTEEEKRINCAPSGQSYSPVEWAGKNAEAMAPGTLHLKEEYVKVRFK